MRILEIYYLVLVVLYIIDYEMDGDYDLPTAFGRGLFEALRMDWWLPHEEVE